MSYLAQSRLALGLLLLTMSALLVGCPSQQLITETPTVAQADDQQATCKVAKDPLNPLIVEWPATAKADLESTSQRGLVVVSYAGCTLKVLSSCEATGAYALTSVTPARDKLRIANDTELYARLPLGVASLKGELKSGSQLELDYVAVGQRVAEKPPVSLGGNCQGATHFVRSITVGAYSLDAYAKGSASASVDVADTAGGGLGRKEDARKIRGSGDVEKCAGDPTAPSCGAVLQLGLAPLQVSSGGDVTAAGFGQGLGPLGVIPDVVPMADVATAGSSSLKDVDLDYLNLLQTAKRAEKDTAGPASAKVNAWAALASYPGKNPLREVAEERQERWQLRAEAEARRLEQLDRLRERYTTDKDKLDKLVALDDDVVTPKQKTAYKNEFAEVYAPWKNELMEIGVVARDVPVAPPGTPGSAVPGDTVVEEGAQEFVMGTPFHIEAEVGYAAVPVVFIPSATATDVTGVSTEALAGGAGLVVGAEIGWPSLLTEGLGLFATFKYFNGDLTSAMNVGAAFRYSLPLADIVALEISLGAAYFTVLGDVTVDYVVAGEPESGVFAPAGFDMEAMYGINFPISYFTFGARGLFELLVLSAGSDTDSNLEVETGIGYGFVGVVGTRF